MKKKPSILLVPPKGSRVKILPIRTWMAAILIIIVVIGFAGFFIPFESLALSAQEQNQHKNLIEQNKRLHQNIGATLRLLANLKENTVRLEAKKEQSMEIFGLPQEKHTSLVKKSKANSASMESGALLNYISEREEHISAFAYLASEGGKNLFESIPVNYPVSPSASIISRRFGTGRDPFTGKQKMHYGVDFAAEIGTPVMASAAGTVTLVEEDPIWGKRIKISHAQGYSTNYSHLGTTRIAQGRSVKRGDVIGTIGLSGLTTGPHVHYELWYKDRPLNPEEYFFPVQELAANR
ncbi:MAG: M23 family metallopeptidase [Chitinispirillales bacterium]|jgi:murein DD-endopeptidase MepM/ murein hydrolase activator NlpD|nr:M23 family metallopeptidase [Chitinispirillales bacterium]